MTSIEPMGLILDRYAKAGPALGRRSCLESNLLVDLTKPTNKPTGSTIILSILKPFLRNTMDIYDRYARSNIS